MLREIWKQHADLKPRALIIALGLALTAPVAVIPFCAPGLRAEMQSVSNSVGNFLYGLCRR